MKKTLVAFLIVGFLVSTGDAKGRRGGHRQAGRTVSVRGYSTKGNGHPSPGQPGTNDPYSYPAGYGGGYGPSHSGPVDGNPSAVSSEMEVPQAGAAGQQSQAPGTSPS